jgi:TRAP-type C4-dicarboxylate transport system permease small subunit
MAKGIKVMDFILMAVTLIAFVGVIVVVTIQILSRQLPYSAIWTEELTRFLFIYAVCCGAPLALKRKEFINVDLLINLLPDKVKRVYDGIVYLIISILCFAIAYYSATFISVGKGQTSATMAIDMSIIHASIGISVFFMAIYALIHVVEHFKSLPRGNNQ